MFMLIPLWYVSPLPKAALTNAFESPSLSTVKTQSSHCLTATAGGGARTPPSSPRQSPSPEVAAASCSSSSPPWFSSECLPPNPGAAGLLHLCENKWGANNPRVRVCCGHGLGASLLWPSPACVSCREAPRSRVTRSSIFGDIMVPGAQETRMTAKCEGDLFNLFGTLSRLLSPPYNPHVLP